MSGDDLGDRMKLLEHAEAGRRFMPLLPVIVRLDGKAFHSYTRDLKKPYDERLSSIMVDVTKMLVKVSGATIGYTQSDEITLVLYSSTYDTQLFFDGKIHKLVSVLASMTSSLFDRMAMLRLPPQRSPSKDDLVLVHDMVEEGEAAPRRPLALFDCRAWQVPTLMEAANAVLWREVDATKNSISAAARCHFSHNVLQDKSGPEMQEMMFQAKGVNWNDYPAFFKRGTYVQRRRRTKELAPEELARIPEKYRPTGPVERLFFEQLEMPPLSRVANRVDVIFSGADPILKADVP